MPTAVLCACIGTPSNEGRPSVHLMTPGVAVQGGSDRRRQGNGARFAERHGHPLNGVHVTRRHVAVMVPRGCQFSYALRQLKSPLSNISSLSLAGLKSTGTFVIQGVTHR